MRKLTQRETEILRCIRRHFREKGYAPSVRDLVAETGLKSTSTVQGYLERLTEYGYIRRSEGKSRSVLLCDPDSNRSVRCLRSDAVPSAEIGEDQLDGCLAFCFEEDLPPDVRAIAILFEAEWWVILQGGESFKNRPRVFFKNGALSLDEKSGEPIGELAAKIKLY